MGKLAEPVKKRRVLMESRPIFGSSDPKMFADICRLPNRENVELRFSVIADALFSQSCQIPGASIPVGFALRMMAGSFS